MLSNVRFDSTKFGTEEKEDRKIMDDVTKLNEALGNCRTLIFSFIKCQHYNEPVYTVAMTEQVSESLSGMGQ